MGHKKPSKKPQTSGAVQKEGPFNRALSGLEKLKQDMLARETELQQQAAAEAARLAAEHARQQARKSRESSPERRSMDLSDDDPELFFRAVNGIKRMGDDPRGDIVRPPPVDRAAGELRALIDFAASVDPESQLQPHDEGELHAGSARSLDKRVLKSLLRGDIEHEAELDLHGASRIEAQAKLQRFMLDALQKKVRCVLVITGRGLGSQAGPVLKEALVDWLARGKLTRYVLAYAQARPKDGGEGAYYVLLRRR